VLQNYFLLLDNSYQGLGSVFHILNMEDVPVQYQAYNITAWCIIASAKGKLCSSTFYRSLVATSIITTPSCRCSSISIYLDRWQNDQTIASTHHPRIVCALPLHSNHGYQRDYRSTYGHMQLDSLWPYTRWCRSSVTVTVKKSDITVHFRRAEVWNVTRDGYKKIENSVITQ
jgi:hypothetical protein